VTTATITSPDRLEIALLQALTEQAAALNRLAP
jgi:hypothetical protein